MRILVTGAAGTVGSYAQDVFDGHDLWLTDREQCDVASRPLRDSMGVRIRFAPALDAVIHLAAATDVDECELDHDLAYRANALGTQNVAEACERAGIPLVYVSTAGVFGGDGGSGPFTEFDPPCPANTYGQSKLAGEVLAREQTRRLYVVRAGWMFGGNTMTDPKFVGMIARLLKNGSCRAVADKTGSPTYARDLLVGIRTMLEDQWPYGTYHMANAGVCTRFDVACAVRDLTMPGAVVAPATSDEFPLPAPRADSEAMVSYKAGLLGLPVLRPWREALAEHLGASVEAAA